MTTQGVSRRQVLGSAGGAAGAALAGHTAAASTAGRSHSRRRGRLVEYWVQADHLRHDAAPIKFDPMMGTPIKDTTTFDAVVYRAYTPGWGKPLPGSAQLGPNTGFPGPVLRGRPGDVLRVHFRNNDSHYRQPHSMHPHGLRYTPENSGAWTAQGTGPGSAVPFGHTFTYEWQVMDSSVGTWPYHDHSKPFAAKPPAHGGGGGGGGGGMSMDAAAVMEMGAELGLMGIIVVDDPAAPAPDREFYLVLHDLYAADVPGLTSDVDCFNGRAFLGNAPTFTARVGERVRWHIIAVGKEFHVFHLHGHRWKDAAGTWVDSQVLGPTTSLVVDYVEDNPGDWLYHCHVTDHMSGGMVGDYKVAL